MPQTTNKEFAFIEFLKAPTPIAWLEKAQHSIPELLLDHAHCERKAAATAINFINQYPERRELVAAMAPLAREELLHFEKVLAIMADRSLVFETLHPAEYAQTLHRQVNKKEPEKRLRDMLIIGAIIEARSCERFNALIPYLEDKGLAKFYSSLVKSEARHFEDYLALAKLYFGDIEERVDYFLTIENRLINSIDQVFRFHSGIPA